MKSKILASLLAATGLTGINAAEQGDLKKIIKGVSELSDKDWGGLSAEAQDWYNDAADALNDKKPIAGFPDAEADETTPTRRRGAVASEPTPAVGGPDILAVGQEVEVENKRGKTYTGVVTELTADVVVLGEGSDAEEIDIDKVVKVKVLKEAEAPAATSRRGKASDEEAGPEVGDTVKVTNKRGKVYEGVIAELTDEAIILDGGDDIDREKVETIAIVKKGKKAAAAKAAEKTDDDKPKRSSNPKGVSVGARIREMMCDTLGISEEAVGKALTKEGIEFRPPTLTMIYKDTKAVIEQLKANGHMKTK